MEYQLTPFLVIYVVILLLTCSLAIYALLRYLRYDRRLQVLAFASLMFSITLWEMTNIVRVGTVLERNKLLLYNVTNGIIVPLFLFSLLFFALAFAREEQWILWVALVAGVQFVGLTAVLTVTPEFLYEAQGLLSRGPATLFGFTFEEWVLLERELSPAFLVYQLYLYAGVLTAAVTIVRYVLSNRAGSSTEQAVLMSTGIAVPLVSNLLVFLGVVPPEFNFTDIGFGVAAASFALAIFRYRLFDLTPVGRQQLFGVMDDPFMLVDTGNRVVDSNREARRMFDVGPEWRGMDATEFLGAHAEKIQPLRTANKSTHKATIETSGTERHFDVSVTAVQTATGNAVGHLIALRDITELERTKRNLKRSNRRLDDFASMVSHDLRTPLNMASVRASRLEEERADEQTEAIQDALNRMESIIDEMLQLARAGDSIETTERCVLREHVNQTWEYVETDDATLDTHTGETAIEADAARLVQVFENLFRNAVDHNDTPVTVRVGTLPERGERAGSGEPVGFYVEDNGDGIPEDERTKVLDHGYTNSDGGTGYGLSIVQYIVEAHGWGLRITDGTDSGARFEITGVEFD